MDLDESLSSVSWLTGCVYMQEIKGVKIQVWRRETEKCELLWSLSKGRLKRTETQ